MGIFQPHSLNAAPLVRKKKKWESENEGEREGRRERQINREETRGKEVKKHNTGKYS